MTTKKKNNDLAALPPEQQVTALRKTIGGLKGHNKKLADQLAQKKADLADMAKMVNGLMTKCTKYKTQIDADAELIEDLSNANRMLKEQIDRQNRPWWKRWF